MNMIIATALIVHRTTVHCLRQGFRLDSRNGLELMTLEYRRFTASADADHLTADDLATIRSELLALGFNVQEF